MDDSDEHYFGGQYVAVLEGKEIVLTPGDELFIPKVKPFRAQPVF
jgi:hypothetical protein